MLNRWSMCLSVCAALGAYTLGARSVLAQPDTFVFRMGETVTFVFAPEWSRTCRIEEIRGSYVRCQNEPGVAGEYWINTDQVPGVTKRPSGNRSK